LEQGQTQMTQSFERRPIAKLLQESRFVGLRDTTFSVQLRSFYEDIDNFNLTESQAWTLGGLAGFKTGYFANFLALGATGYTSQALDAPLDRSGTKLLREDQMPYSVIGELYGEFRLTDEIGATVGRRGFDTPFINTQDSFMTPNTFQVYSVTGVVGNSDDAALRFGAGYVDKIKPRNSEDFESMATAAGAPAGVVRGVDVAGANYKLGAFSIGAIDYYSKDIINIAYTEITYAMPLANRVRLTLGAQYADQRSSGDNLLTGQSFLTDQGGVKADLAMGTLLLTAARTQTAVGTRSSNGSGTDMRNPWGAYPGYTAVQIENFYRAGENATMLRAAYNFPKEDKEPEHMLVLGGALAFRTVLQMAGAPRADEVAWDPSGSTRFGAYAHRMWDALLAQRGYDVGGPPDGDIGTKSKAAIADFQQKSGLEVNGRASVKVLAALKK